MKIKWRASSSGQDLGLWFRYAWVRIPSGAPFKEALVRVFFYAPMRMRTHFRVRARSEQRRCNKLHPTNCHPEFISGSIQNPSAKCFYEKNEIL